MKYDRMQLIDKIRREIAGRRLIWLGIRGADAEPLLEFPEFSESFALIAPLGSRRVLLDVTLEEATHVRPDLERYLLSEDRSPQADAFREAIQASLREPAVVLPYRPTTFLPATRFPRGGEVEFLGLFQELQERFEHKPWVESQLARRGLRIIPWEYFSRDDFDELLAKARERPLVLRSSRSSGGAGLGLARSPEDVLAWLPGDSETIVAAAPFLEHNIPLNVGGCVFPDGTMTLHAPSLQLIGIQGLTNRLFGYCGNDFGAIKLLSASALEELERMAREAATWLHAQGYIGAFGMDAIYFEGRVYFCEINPRFQGSSALSARIDADLGRPDIYLTQMAAFLGIPFSDDSKLVDLAARQAPVSQVICHNIFQYPVRVRSDIEPKLLLEPGREVHVSTEGIVGKSVLPSTVTGTGRSLHATVSRTLRESIYARLQAPPRISP